MVRCPSHKSPKRTRSPCSVYTMASAAFKSSSVVGLANWLNSRFFSAFLASCRSRLLGVDEADELGESDNPEAFEYSDDRDPYAATSMESRARSYS